MGAFSRLVGASLIVGAGVAALGVVVIAPGILRASRPAAREGLKYGLQAYKRARKAATEVAEDVEDMVAEVQSELKHKPSEGDRDAGHDQPEPAPGT